MPMPRWAFRSEESWARTNEKDTAKEVEKRGPRIITGERKDKGHGKGKAEDDGGRSGRSGRSGWRTDVGSKRPGERRRMTEEDIATRNWKNRQRMKDKTAERTMQKHEEEKRQRQEEEEMRRRGEEECRQRRAQGTTKNTKNKRSIEAWQRRNQRFFERLAAGLIGKDDGSKIYTLIHRSLPLARLRAQGSATGELARGEGRGAVDLYRLRRPRVRRCLGRVDRREEA